MSLGAVVVEVDPGFSSSSWIGASAIVLAFLGNSLKRVPQIGLQIQILRSSNRRNCHDSCHATQKLLWWCPLKFQNNKCHYPHHRIPLTFRPYSHREPWSAASSY